MPHDPDSAGFRAALDNYITGGRFHRCEVTLRCTFCHAAGESDVTFSAYSEYGGTWLDEEDEGWCPLHHADGSECPIPGDRWRDKKGGCKAEHQERDNV